MKHSSTNLLFKVKLHLGLDTLSVFVNNFRVK